MAEIISFKSAGFLWLTPLVLLVAWWAARRRRPAMRFSDTGGFARRTGGRAWRATWGSAILRGLACLSLILACAGPRRPDLQTRLPAEGISIVMAVDVSGSMGTPDVAWNPGSPPVTRLEAARRAFKLFVGGGEVPDGTKLDPRAGDSIGLVTFAAVPETACPPTLNHSVLLKIVEKLEPKGGVDAGTNVGEALGEGIIRLDAAKGQRKVLILLSDGEHNVHKEDNPGAKRPGIDRTAKPREAAQLAANLNPPVKIYTIDTGGDPPPGTKAELVEQREAGRASLRAVAEMTGGKSFAATSGAELLAAYREISALEKVEVESYQYRRYFEYYPWCAAAALVLLLMAHALDRTLWRVVT